MQTIKVLLLLAVCTVWGTAASRSVEPDAGTVLYPFLSIASDARSASLAGTAIGVPGQVFAIGTNPGSSAFLNRTQAGISFNPVLQDVMGAAIAAAHPMEGLGTVGIFVDYFSAGAFDSLLDKDGNSIPGSIHPYDIAGGISFARLIAPTLGVGGMVKGIYSVVNPGEGNTFARASSDAFALDLGGQYRSPRRVTYGIAIRNFGFVHSAYADAYRDAYLPVSAGAGISYQTRSEPQTLLAIDAEKTNGASLLIRGGAEIAVLKQYLRLRLGSSITARDIRMIIDHASGSDDGLALVRNNWEVMSIGLGAAAPMRSTLLEFDAALRLRIGALPGFNVSLAAGF